MSLKKYVKDNMFHIIVVILLLGIVHFLLYVFGVHLFLKIYIPLLILICFLLSFFVGYIRKRGFYQKLEENLASLDHKYYIFEMLKEPSFLEGTILYHTIEEITKATFDHVNEYKYASEEYREYIELWVHEIKTPIASSRLIIENNPSQVTKSVEEELQKIEEFVEQVLYYARSNVVQKDYIIKPYSLENIINQVIKKNKNDLISRKIAIGLENLNVTVNTDTKWLSYILQQILNNSIKYSKESDPSITFCTKSYRDSIQLYIHDNGIGIESSELSRVFEKGFTGKSGRYYTKSTGMGLYLCKMLLTKLGHDIQIRSEHGQGTTVVITFPCNSLIDDVII